MLVLGLTLFFFWGGEGLGDPIFWFIFLLVGLK